jgi:membrane fusion protein (multidrug efflux system)
MLRTLIAIAFRRTHTRLLILISGGCIGSFMTGCGKPPAADGQYGDFPVNAVVAPVERILLEDKIALVGSLNAIDSVDIVSEVDARIEEILFDEGEQVSAGDVLIRFDDRKLSAALSQTRARFELARTNLERAASLLERETITQQDYDQAAAEFEALEAVLELERQRLDDTIIRAPFSGVLSEHSVSRGQYLTRGQRLTSVVSINPIEVAFFVPERYSGQIALRQSIAVTVEAYPDEAFEGKIAFIAPEVDRQTRTVLVKARLDNTDGRLKPGMFGSLNLVFTVMKDALAIPEAAVQYNRDQASVVVMDAEGKAAFRNVTVGERLAGFARITEGLEQGERVVVEGFQKMRPGSTILISAESNRFGLEASSQPGA